MRPDERTITYSEILKTVKLLRGQPIQTGPRRFYVAGSGFTDEFLVDWFRGTGIIVVTRDGTKWLNGIQVSDVHLDCRGGVSNLQFTIYKALCEYPIEISKLRLEHKLRQYHGPSDEVIKKVVALCRRL